MDSWWARTRSSREERELAWANKGGGKDSDFIVVVSPWVEVRSARKSIGFVGSVQEVNKGEVVVGEVRNVACDTSVNVL